MIKNKSLLTSYLSLFSSFGTIICCALPSLLVSIGMGATFAGLIGIFPQIVWLSENKILVFGVSGLMILGSGLLTYWNRNAPCPIDPDLARACITSRKWSIRISVFSGLIWLTGFLFAFVTPVVMNLSDSP
ncbi:MAG: hypothetical protein ACRBBP_02465 [Bdellovibrionales bacterium]